MSNRELKIIIKADGSLAAEEIDKVSKELTDLGKDATKTGRELDKVDKELTDLGKGAEKTSRDLDKVDKELTDLGKDSNRTGQALDQVGKEMTDLGRESSRSGQQLNQTVRIIIQAANANKQASQETKKAKLSWDALGRSKQLLASGWDVAFQGAKLQEARASFDDYARSIGKNSEDILIKLRKASGGTISDMGLIVTASKAMSLGVTTDSGKMANLLEIARNKARLFGIDTSQAFEDIVTGIGRNSPLILDNLGIKIPAGFEKMTEGMSDADKIAKLLELTLIEGNKQLKDMGGLTNNSADKMRAFSAAVTNLKGELGILASEGLLSVAEELRALMPDVKLAIEQFRILASVMNAPGQIAATLYYDKELKKNPETLEEAQKQFYETHERITELSRRMKEIKPELTTGAIAFDILKGKAGFDSYIKMGTELKKLEKRAEDLERFILALDKEEKKAKHQAFINEIFGPTEAQFKEINDLWRATENELAAEGQKKTGKEEADISEHEKALKARQRELRKELEERKKLFEALPPHIEEGQKELAKFLDEMERLADKDTQIKSVVDTLTNLSELDFSSTLNQFGGDLDNMLAATNQTLFAMNALSGGLLGAKGSKPVTQAGAAAQMMYQASDGMIGYGGEGLFEQKLKENFAKVKESAKDLENPLADTIARSISDGFARADFSGFLQSLGGGLSSVVGGVLTDTIQSALSGCNTGTLASGNNILGGLFKPVYNKSGSLNMGALGQNLAVGAAFSFLTSPGRLFGGSVVKGQESFNTSASLNDQVGQAKELRDQLFLQVGISEMTRQLLDEAEFYYAWVRKTKSGNGITSKKTTTYLLEGSGQAQSSIDNIKKLQETVLGEQSQRNYSLFQIVRGDSIKALEMAVSDAASASSAAWATNMPKSETNVLNAQLQDLYRQRAQAQAQIQTQPRQGGFPFAGGWQVTAISNQIAELEKKISEGYDYKYSVAERTAMQQQYEQAKIDLITAKESGRTNLAQTFLGSSTLASFVPADVMKELLGDSALGNDQQMIRQMLPLLKNAGLADFDLRKMALDAGDDPEKQAAVSKKQIEYLQKAGSVYEQLWKDAEQEALNAALSIEQQKAAFERFQAAQSSFLDVKEQILQQEQQLAAIEKQKLESRRIANIESALSLVGELNARQNGVVIIQAGDSSVAIKELMAEFADNPEVTAILQSTLEKTEAKTRWGN